MTPRHAPMPSVRNGTASIVICTRRDLQHPDGGGSELYVETLAQHLVRAGNEVTILCAAVAGRPIEEIVAGVRYRRAGGPFSAYLQAAWALLARRVRADVVLDVQNGIPFLSPLVSKAPVSVLLHHVHAEQWPMVYGRLAARLGWWIESRVGPAIYRRARYITVCEATRTELTRQGIDPTRVSIAYNGTPPRRALTAARSPEPRLVVLGRLVPHKRVEIVLRAAAVLRHRFDGLKIDVVGHGSWADRLRDLAAELGVEDIVTFHGFVDEDTKAELLGRAWLGVVPSVKEGWGLAVVEAASYGTASVAFAHAGGLSESIVNSTTGILVDGDEDAFIEQLGVLLADPDRCRRLGRRARQHAAAFTWPATVTTVSDVLDTSVRRRRGIGRTTGEPDSVASPPPNRAAHDVGPRLVGSTPRSYKTVRSMP
ncbi:glycosyltransferase family 4 protein [Streptomyces chartreusis]|uniref:glycosyltransferase family 4 protein n=1 Tax=Streptomyces chartreusis TaxID=1969 RepID=UPI003686369F